MANARKIAFIIVVLGAILRIPGIFGDPWLDEIWSIELVSTISSPTQIFTAICHDNNHILNSLWIWLSGASHNPILLRVFSLFWSLASLILVAFFFKFKNEPYRIVLIMFLALSYPLIVYGTEARGYSSLVFFSLLSIKFLFEGNFAKSKKSAFAYILISLLGYLSHRTFLTLLLSGGIWRTVLDLRSEGIRGSKTTLIITLLVPISLMVVLESFRSCPIVIAGGPSVEIGKVLSETVSIFYGISFTNIGAGLLHSISALIIVIIVYELIADLLDLSSQSWFFLLAIFIFPLGMIFFGQQEFIRPRYFIIPGILSYFPISSFIMRFWEKGSISRRSALLPVMFFASFVIGNSILLRDFYLFQRGSYSKGIEKIVNYSSDGTINVCGNPDFWNHKILDFYAASIDAEKQINYEDGFLNCGVSPDWLIINSIRNKSSPCKGCVLEMNNQKYTVNAFYPSGPLSGYSWWLLHKSN